ncbi:hypothetical protein HANVADRAFT_51085 [Hanseniaspora valbyensis NRRL Y-1626]|uniref:Uncharacterized protein n=1 Tax=Hanseniaspora valbyensis NRRL Y-1626 TaxID=766949 RepID=A0A1B7TKB1_9ASCO|nr:hypothetical protein HANVADRAFT_51085 [Hanseniaspora valbyensis NRRL Y-1626]
MVKFIDDLGDINEVIKVVNTLASLLLGLLSVILIHRINVLKYHIPLVIIAVSSLLIFVIDVVDNIIQMPMFNDGVYRLKRRQSTKLILVLIVLNFLIFGSSIGFINNLISKESFEDQDKKIIVAQLAFLLLQQLTFFSMVKNYKQGNNEEMDAYYTDPESLVMKPMRIPNKKRIQNKASEQTLTPNLDWLQQHEFENNVTSNSSINKYEINSFNDLNNTNVNTNIKQKKWKRAFSKLIKFKPEEEEEVKEQTSKNLDSLSQLNLNNKSQSLLNINPKFTHYTNETRSVCSQPDMSHDLTIMLEVNNRENSTNTIKNDDKLEAFSDSFEKKLDAEQIALTRINSRLLPPRLTTKQSYTNMKHKRKTSSGGSGSRIPSDELESPINSISKIPAKFFNGLPIINNHENVSTQLLSNQPMNLNNEEDALDFLDNFFTLNKKNYHQAYPSFDMSTSQEIDEDMINSALSDSLSKRSIVNTNNTNGNINDNNYNALNSNRHSPTKSISSLRIMKHKKSQSLISNSALSISPKKPSHNQNVNPKHSHSKTLSTKLSLSNISFNINEDGKIDFTPQKLPEFEISKQTENMSRRNSLWEQNMKLDDIEEKRKISDNSFEYPQVLVSEYDKEKWKIISDYA